MWGAAVDTLENTSRFAEGKDTGPMCVLHLFDSPLTVTRPYEAYFGNLTVPRAVAKAAERRSVMLDWATPRAQRARRDRAPTRHQRENVHVWTLARKEPRQAHEPPVGRVDELGRAPGGGRLDSARRACHSSPTPAPTRRPSSWQSWKDEKARRTCSSATATPRPPRRCRPRACPRCSTSTAPWRCSRPPSTCRTTRSTALMRSAPERRELHRPGEGAVAGPGARPATSVQSGGRPSSNVPLRPAHAARRGLPAREALAACSRRSAT